MPLARESYFWRGQRSAEGGITGEDAVGSQLSWTRRWKDAIDANTAALVRLT